MNLGRLMTPAQVVAACPGLTMGSLKWMLFNAQENGLAAAGAVIHVGRKVLIDEEAFLRWLEARRSGATDHATQG